LVFVVIVAVIAIGVLLSSFSGFYVDLRWLR